MIAKAGVIAFLATKHHGIAMMTVKQPTIPMRELLGLKRLVVRHFGAAQCLNCSPYAAIVISSRGCSRSKLVQIFEFN